MRIVNHGEEEEEAYIELVLGIGSKTLIAI